MRFIEPALDRDKHTADAKYNYNDLVIPQGKTDSNKTPILLGMRMLVIKQI